MALADELMELLMRELAARLHPRPGMPKQIPGRPLPFLPLRPQIETIRVVAERHAADRALLAATGLGFDARPILILAEFAQDAQGSWWRRASLEGRDEPIAGKPDPWLRMSAQWHRAGFVGGGRIQTERADIAGIRLRWDDGRELEATVEDNVALFLALDAPRDPARVEFYDAGDKLLGSHVTLRDEPEPLPARS